MQLTKHWAATLDDYVIDLAWSPDGALLAAASGSGPVSLFASTDGVRRHELPGHENGTNCLAWQPGAAALATGGQDGAVKFWDPAAGQHTATAKLGSAWVEHLAWKVGRVTPDAPGSTGDSERRIKDNPRCLAAAAGRDAFFLNPDGSIAHKFKPAPKTITALAWQPDRRTEDRGRRSEDGGRRIEVSHSESSSVLSLQSSDLPTPSSAPVAAVAYFGGISLWAPDDFILQKELPYANGIHALAWSPDGKWLVSGNQDPSVHLWIPAEDIELHMSGYETKVKHLSFDHTSRWLATGGGRDACIWDCAGAGPEGREPAMFPHDAPVCALAFQHAHGLLATASADGVVQLWSPGRKQPLRATVKMSVAATKLAWSPDDRLLAIGSEKGAVYVLKCEA